MDGTAAAAIEGCTSTKNEHKISCNTSFVIIIIPVQLSQTVHKGVVSINLLAYGFRDDMLMFDCTIQCLININKFIIKAIIIYNELFFNKIFL